MTTLKLGSKGSDVKLLQEKLSLIQDGVFGPLTEEAVKEFQELHKLTADGIVGSSTWALLTKGNPRKIKEIILHCSDTPEGRETTTDDIRAWHLLRGFSDIGYHYVIYLDGSVHPGRDESVTGAHCTGHNSSSIGICYVGGCDKKMNPKDTRTDALKRALVTLVSNLLHKYNLPISSVHGHYEFSEKACPSFKIETFLKEL